MAGLSPPIPKSDDVAGRVSITSVDSGLNGLSELIVESRVGRSGAASRNTSDPKGAALSCLSGPTFA